MIIHKTVCAQACISEMSTADTLLLQTLQPLVKLSKS